MRTLGVDLGKARIGLALADEVLRTARPLETVRHVSAEADVARIVALAREWEATRAVVGLPLNMDGTEGPAARHARAFAARLEAAGLPVVLFDERLSTFEAEQRLRDQGVPGRTIRERVDAEAAAVILQGWLDAGPRPGDPGDGG
ncbi:MAG: Holliday junction resolvase RuvX [Anaeromyxobacter sp.]